MKKKTIALLLGIAMLFAAFAPGVFAEEVNPTPTPTAETPGEQKTVESTETPAEQATTPPVTTEPAEPTAAPTETQTETPVADATAEPTAPTTVPTTQPTTEPTATPTETPAVCTCNATMEEKAADGFVHAKTCPLYEAPKCSCGAVAAEDGTIAHVEGCPLYEEPVEIEYVDIPFRGVGPIIAYEPFAVFKSADPIANNAAAYSTETATNTAIYYKKDGSQSSVNPDLWVDKTVTEYEFDTVGTTGFKLNLSAGAVSKVVEVASGVDIILLLDMSANMQASAAVSNRLEAMQTAVNNFIDGIATRSPGSRIAIVSYADTSDVLSGSKDASDLALVTVDSEGASILKGLVSGLSSPRGNSNCDLAMFDALKIFQSANKNEKTDQQNTKYNERDRVTILFSAGVPGSGFDDEDNKDGHNHAQGAMGLSGVLKGTRFSVINVPGQNMDGGQNWDDLKDRYNSLNYEGCDSTVYCVGLNLPQTGAVESIAMNDSQIRPAVLTNEYLYRVSSHRPTSEHLYKSSLNDEWINAINRAIVNGKYYDYIYGDYAEYCYYFYPDELTRNQEDGYFLTAEDDNLSTLTDIFKSISEQVGMSANTKIVDYIQPQFDLVKDDGTEYKSGDSINSNGNIGTVGYDEETNRWYVEWYNVPLTPGGTDGEGAQEFDATLYVKPKDRFLGGNDVYTNGEASGLTIEEIDYAFPRPTVNVPIEDITVTAEDKNVYLLNGLTAEELRSGAAATVGNVKLDLTKPDQNYGLEDWQTSGVDISVVITDAEENAVDAELTGLRENTTYNVEVQVSPKETAATTSSGTAATEKSGEATGKINVFKPELTFKDSNVYYGDTVPTNFTDNLTSTVWKHGDTKSTDSGVTMIGDKAPDLTLTYTPEEGKIVYNKINTKQDVPVNVTVNIGEGDVTGHTTFKHDSCTETNCGFNAETEEFLLHVKTCQLTITKSGGNANEPYVFTINRGGAKYTEASITGNNSVTICELPVGTYTIQEDTGWSWRYSADNGNSAELTADVPTGSITCTNSDPITKWLNGFSSVVKNIFGVSTTMNAN